MVGTRISSLLGKITVLFVICCCCLPAHAKYGGGSGTPEDPYLIYTAEQMNAIGADQNDWDKHFKLMANLDLGQFTGEEFNIIGYYVSYSNNKPFSGVFDGNGHTISNFSYTSTGTSYIGVFGYVRGDNAEIKDLGLIDPNVDAGTHGRVGSLVGGLREATITNCYAERGSVSGNELVGGLVGFNDESTISNCYSTASVSGNDLIGGLVGHNWDLSVITNCYSTGNVTGDRYVGGLVGYNYSGTITNCDSSGDVEGNSAVGGLVGWTWDYSTITNCFSSGNVTGNGSVGGLVGSNNESTISNCYSTASVEGGIFVGGLVGGNREGSVLNCSSTGDVNGVSHVGGLVGYNSSWCAITNCYSKGDVSGESQVGGLVGDNYWLGKITNCYSTGSVVGNLRVGGLVGWNRNNSKITNSYSNGSVQGAENVGGLVGENPEGEATNSFWDVETSGQTISAGGTGKTTAEMQMQVTFTDAGWDFVGETVKGIEDIWFIPQQDYPHLWWEGMQVPMKLTPVSLNCRSEGKWIKAHITLPEGFTVADVNSERPAVLHSFGFQSAPLYVFINKDKVVEIEAAFERQAICSLTGDWPQALTVAGFFADGNIFLGTSNVRIIHPGLKVIEELASCWLQGDCVYPETDMNRDSLVNLLDYALLMNIEVEFVTDE
ncbi:MAG: hypothetical protein OEW48_11485 [Phycisphaerae bacterium]|nr:hypothetical protein [Phycisphaerae bacterium]